MCCNICGVAETAELHHYDCPNDANFDKKRLVTMKATKDERDGKYAHLVSWRRQDGTGYIIVKPL